MLSLEVDSVGLVDILLRTNFFRAVMLNTFPNLMDHVRSLMSNIKWAIYIPSEHGSFILKGEEDVAMEIALSPFNMQHLCRKLVFEAIALP
jgi:hypothetical protein